MVFIKILGNNFQKLKINKNYIKNYNILKLGFLKKKKIIKKNIFLKKEIKFILKLKKMNFISFYILNNMKFNFFKLTKKLNIYINIFLKYFENKPLFFF